MSELSHRHRTPVPPRPGTKRPSPARSVPRPVEPGQGRSSVRQAIAARRKRARLALGAGALVVVAMAALLATYAAGGGTGPATNASGTFAVAARSLQPLEATSPAALRRALTDWPATASPLIALPASTPALRNGGKPELLYIGANYCPYCAAQRWPLLVALSKFGKFSGLRGTTSSATDINASTPTLTFSSARYTSPYLSFVAVETHGNIPGPNGNYPVLEKLTARQSAIFSRYDAAPYVPPSGAGGIPFLDLGGRYVFVGSQYDAAPIAGWDFDRAATYLASGQNATSRSMRVAAAYLVRGICQLTGASPASACK